MRACARSRSRTDLMNWRRFSWWWGCYCLSACSVIVDPSTLVIKCEVSASRASEDPCLIAGMHCVDSECKPCKHESEICNGVDDDCDGVIDNGHDEDNDGFTWCGGGRPEYADCAPNDPKIYPAGPENSTLADGRGTAAPEEACDGKDNDCDSKVDEASECATTGSCVSDGCREGQVCNALTGVCIEPRPVGSGCTSDAECAGGFCVKRGEYAPGVTLTDDRCASACCTDSNCAAGSVCVVGAAGRRSCLPNNIAGRGTQAESERCARDSECASGSCVASRCATRCAEAAACKSAECMLSSGGASETRRWTCGEARGRGDTGDSCSSFDPSACRSGLCVNGNCAEPCGRNADCPRGELCRYSTLRGLVPLPLGAAAIVAYCAPAPSAEARSAEARERLCCTNADCNSEQQCAPYGLESGLWMMICR
ncbi:MAG: hypothetical protein RL701_4327 [Pseudomonadota bacterium]